MQTLKPSKRRSFFRKNAVMLLILVVLCGVTIYYVNQKDTLIDFYVMPYNEPVNNASCHYLEEGDALPSAEHEEFSPRPNSIFFHETSCRGGLTPRQACAVEAATRAHPRKQVYVLFSAPVNKFAFRRKTMSKLRLFPNIRFARVHLTEYAKNTPLEEMVAEKPFHESQWWVEHTSDILRYLTLYKWGGLYLDTDIMVVKSLLPLGHNWVAKEDNDKLVNAAAIAISMDHLGRKLATALINEVNTNYRPDLWAHNGPEAITRVLEKTCTTKNVTEWSSRTCDGLEVYAKELIYPIYYSHKDLYFKRGDLDEDIRDQAYTHHLWNKLTYAMKIEKDSPYAKMAAEFCPTIYKTYGSEFGA